MHPDAYYCNNYDNDCGNDDDDGGGDDDNDDI